ncbi:hypothetical protein VIGAN_07152100 [Vigna angularis var. angularis]|uniref:Uncharacterized protein n=1 Tax=Vigna angularis var. angularis TaxID=157739 RepID=A0A0S3SIL6_PHAAN|nr:hypothetical protein VIGAN_07152100 [Vigna angularis var. angularis]
MSGKFTVLSFIFFTLESTLNGCYGIPWVHYKGWQGDFYILVNSIWMVRFGELKGVGAMIEQVKGFSYSVFYLHGASPFLPTVDGDVQEKHNESITTT